MYLSTSQFGLQLCLLLVGLIPQVTKKDTRKDVFAISTHSFGDYSDIILHI